MEITANQLIGLNVYSLKQGERIGIVRNFLLDPKEKELIALLVGNKKIIKDETVVLDATVILNGKVQYTNENVITSNNGKSVKRTENAEGLAYILYQ